MLVPGDLAAKMIQAAKSGNASAMTILGNTISAYLIANTELKFSWNGILITSNGPVPDPVVLANGKLLSCPIVLTAVPSMQAMAQQITAGVGKAIFTTIAPHVCATTIMVVKPLVLTPTGTNDQAASMNQLATKIITWFKTQVTPTPLTGANGPYTAPTGTGAIMTTIV